MPGAELALFPLPNMVLFPDMVLRLHIFEPRYVRMTEQALADDSRFGMVLPKSGGEEGEPAEPHAIGTVAQIRESVPLDNSHYLLAVSGERRFRIDDYHIESDGLMIGQVSYLDDEPATGPDLEALADRVRQLAGESFDLIRQHHLPLPEIELPDDPVALSFVLAGHLEAGPEQRQQLLATTDTVDRLRQLQTMLERGNEILNHRLEIREEADRVRGGNGRLGDDHLDAEALRRLDH